MGCITTEEIEHYRTLTPVSLSVSPFVSPSLPLIYTRQNGVEGTTGEGRSFASALPDGTGFCAIQGRRAAIAVSLKELMGIWMVNAPVSG